MKRYLAILPLLLVFVACKTARGPMLYQSNAFRVLPDKVTQGKNVATVLSPTHIVSNYQSPASQTFSRLVTFKFSINEKDNEARPGQDHWVVIGDEHQSPVLKFGEMPARPPAPPASFLPVNYAYTFRVDMSPVLNQFKEKGYYEAYDGTRIAKSDFKGFYIAGGAEPLTWDFVNLGNRGLKLEDRDGDNVYEITVRLNPYDPAAARERAWKLEKDLSARPRYTSQQPLVDALFNLSLEEAIKNIEPDSTFRTGAKWGGVWTRDISYSILLAFAYHEPSVAKISLMKKVNRGRIIQDTGSGGAWPVSSDRTTWALAAWEIYQATGDADWLRQSYNIIKATLEDDARTLRSPQTGMYRGESSFLDWREQTYPKWMSNMDIYVSENLGTNAVHYRAHLILADMAKLLGEPYQPYLDRAAAIKTGMNRYLWMADRGYYGQYLYGRPTLTLSPRFEALGEALSILFGVADAQQARSILSKSPVTEYGVTCIYPQIPGIPPYHNNAIWPFVQSYWNLAAAKTGHERALTHGLAAIYRAAGLFLTNYENMVAQTGDFHGTEINSDRMLWSMAGNLAMVHRVLIGMSFEPGGIRFSPAVPRAYGGDKTLSNFRYRGAVLTITVHGFGNKIKSFTLDGQAKAEPFVPANLTGAHTIEITLDDRPFDADPLNLVPNSFSLPNPQARLDDATLSWDAVPGAVAYQVYKNGAFVEKITASSYAVNTKEVADYKVSAVDKAGVESFTSEPVLVTTPESRYKFELEDYITPAQLPYVNYSGRGFIETTRQLNKTLEFIVTVSDPGTYLLDVRYSNGSGPWNTDNKCAIRSLFINEKYNGVLVFPQRGTDEWSDWGWSNAVAVELKSGDNRIKIGFEDWNNNMNVDVNRAMLDYVRLVKR